MKRKLLIAGGIVLVLLVLVPFYTAAVTNPEATATMVDAMKEYTKGMVSFLEVTFCAQGVTALCP